MLSGHEAHFKMCPTIVPGDKTNAFKHNFFVLLKCVSAHFTHLGTFKNVSNHQYNFHLLLDINCKLYMRYIHNQSKVNNVYKEMSDTMQPE